MDYTEGIPSPGIFRQWSAIATAAASLERRCWVETARKVLYPNMFVLLVGPPASGKSVSIDHAKDLIREVKKFHVAPSSVTSASLIDAIGEADRKIMNGSQLVEYKSLIVQSSEFGVLVPSHDLEFMAQLNDIYDCPRVFSQKRRHQHGGKTREIINPQVNILAGAQPGFLSSLLPEEAWHMGFTSRLVMIYANSAPPVELFPTVSLEADQAQQAKARNLVRGLLVMSSLMGKMEWTEDAMKYLGDWARQGCPPVPESPRLQHYSGRRGLHMIKLCMTTCAMRLAFLSENERELRITLRDVETAKGWLLHAETLMPDIFRDMIMRSDGQVLQELHFFLWRLWMKDKKPIHEARILSFLSAKAPSEKVMRLLELAERSNMIKRHAGTAQYEPLPKANHGEAAEI